MTSATVDVNSKKKTATNINIIMSLPVGELLKFFKSSSGIHKLSMFRCICNNTEVRSACIAANKVWDPDTCQCYCPKDTIQTCPTG